MRARSQSNRQFGRPITNHTSNIVVGTIAGAEEAAVSLRAVNKRGSNENAAVVPSKKIKQENQENAVPNKGKGEKPSQKKCQEDHKMATVDVVDLTNSPTVSQCFQATVNQVESEVRCLDISEDDPIKKVTRNGSIKQSVGIIQQVTTAVSAILSVPTLAMACPSKPKRFVALRGIVDEALLSTRDSIDFSDPSTYYESPPDIPDCVDDFDKSQVAEVASEPHYADSVFKYYKALETKYQLPDYMAKQKHVTKAMRSVLVDWMVEVQESFELNHETLYLGVKLVDHYMSKEVIAKEKFQLLGATCLFVASKFDERIPPSIEDFLYICDDAYLRKDLISFEMEVVKKLGFFVGFAISYRFLRRYARVAKMTMEQLTLARYILEMSLMDYDVTCFEKDSKVAAAALLLALRMKGMSWTISLEFYSGYEESDLITLMWKLNGLIAFPIKTNKTVRQKYSHKIFFEVAKIPPLPSK